YRAHDGVTEPYYERLKSDPFLKKYAELPLEKRMPWERKVADARYALALYSGEVTYVDGLLGMAFQKSPRLREGWIGLTADHGESHGEQGLWWEHNRIYPSTLNVPLVIAGPGVPVGRTGRSVSNASLGATLLGLAGVGAEYPGERLDRVVAGPGVSDKPAGESAAGGGASEPHWVVGLAGNSAGVFLDGWYFLLNVRFKNKGRDTYHPAELYELASDPMCEVNVVEDHPERAARMRSMLVSYLADLPEGGTLRVKDSSATSADRADMLALGYGDADESIEGPLVDPACACLFCERARRVLGR
ncbi:MAG: sulfatase-like hydrolase/transferase, partial [Planctomycetota bacterium]